MHVIEIGIERASNPYPFGKVEIKKGEKHKQGILSGDEEWCSKHTLSRDSGRATNRLVGNLGEMLTRNQK